jgi:hypothetical protein
MGTTYIYANTGQVVRLVLQTTNVQGYLIDGYIPVVTSIIFPDLTVATGYPKEMIRLNTGLYIHGIQLPKGVAGLGTYIASVMWIESTSSNDLIGSTSTTLVNGSATVSVPNGLSNNAIVMLNRKTTIGQIGDLSTINQTTSGFEIVSSSMYDQSEINCIWISESTSSNDLIGSTSTTLVNGSATVSVPNGLPNNAIVMFNRKTTIGQIGDLSTINQTTSGFEIVSSSMYDQSEINCIWISELISVSGIVRMPKWETFVINASRPFSVFSMS